MKPKPLVALNHLTVPVDILVSPRCANARCARTNIRASVNPSSAMSWGVEPVRRDQQGKSIVRMRGVYAVAPKIASQSAEHDEMLIIGNRGSAEPADLLFGHHALDILGLALDPVARAAVRLDRQATDDGIDAALLDVGAALRTLLLVMDVVIDREVMGHGRCSLEDGLLGVTGS